jgi:hypothetical protein
MRKYKVGSKTDKELGLNLATYPDLVGGTVREYTLRDTDHISVLIVEKDNKIVFVEDLSD